MAKGKGRGRPRKTQDLTEVKQADNEEVPYDEADEDVFKIISVPSGSTIVGEVIKPGLSFTPEERERIKSSEEVYLVTKNSEKLENGQRDKQIHRAEWLKEVV